MSAGARAEGRGRGTNLVQGGAWSLVLRVAALPVGVALSAVLARTLTEAELGMYFLATSIVLFGRLFGAMGLGAAATRRIAEAMSRGTDALAAAISRQALLVAGVGGLVVGVLYLPAAGIIARLLGAPGLADVAAWVAVLIGIDSVSLVVAGVFRGYSDIRSALLFEGLLARVVLIGALGAAWLARDVHLDLSDVLGLLAAGGGVSVVIALTGVVRLARHDAPSERLPSAAARGLVTVGLPIMLMNLSGVLRGYFDLWLVGNTQGSSDVAVYGVASRVAVLVALPLQAAASALPPVVAGMSAAGKLDELSDTLRASATVATLLAGVGVALCAGFGSTILALVFGPTYAGAAPILTALAFGWLGLTICAPAGTALTMTGHERVVMGAALCVVALTCIVALLVIDTLGLVGLAWVVALGNALQGVTLVVLVRLRLGIWVHATIRPRFGRLRG